MLQLKHIDFSGTRLFRLKMPILNPFMTHSSYEVRMSFTIILWEKKEAESLMKTELERMSAVSTICIHYNNACLCMLSGVG